MNGWKHRGVLAAMLLALTGISVPKADAQQALTKRSSVFSHGIELSLRVPRSTYARNALVQVDIVLRNVSHKTVLVPPSCTADNPAAQVVSRDGMVTYPPALLSMPAAEPSCQLLSPPLPLRPGGIIKGRPYVVLRSNTLRAVANFQVLTQGTSRSNPAVIHMATRPVRVRLVRRPAPHIILTGAPALHAYVVSAILNGRGRLLYMDWYTCQNPQGRILGGHTVAWTPDPQSPILVPGCDEPTQWHVVAGWRGQPVAYLNYVHTDSSFSTSYRTERAKSRTDQGTRTFTSTEPAMRPVWW